MTTDVATNAPAEGAEIAVSSGVTNDHPKADPVATKLATPRAAVDTSAAKAVSPRAGEHASAEPVTPAATTETTIKSPRETVKSPRADAIKSPRSVPTVDGAPAVKVATPRAVEALKLLSPRGPAQPSDTYSSMSSTPRTSGAKIYKSKVPAPEFPSESLWEFLGGRIKAAGTKPCLIDAMSNTVYTGTDVYTMCYKVAVSLIKQGFKKGDCLITNAINCIEYRYISLGAMAAGGMFSGASPMFLPSEFADQIRDANATWVFTHPAVLAQSVKACEETNIPKERHIVMGGPGNEHVTSWDEFIAHAGEDYASVELPKCDSEEVCFLPYSSGTTGRPKGVMLTHKNLICNLLQTDVMEPNPTSPKILLILPLYHVYGFLLMGLAQKQHLAVIIVPKFELEPVLKIMSEYKLSMFHLVPPIAALLAAHPAVDKYDLRALKICINAAAPLPETTEIALQKRIGVRTKQGYGMSELSPCATTCRIENFKPNSVGELLPATEMRIVNPETGQDCEVGVSGEIWIRGPQVMKGYLNRPDATAETIRPDGFLKTGDVGYIDQEGFVFLTDRLKDLIKYKGHQVCPTELEAILLLHPSVADCAVVPFIGADQEEIPKAFIKRKDPSDTVTEDQIMEFVAERVSPFKKVRALQFISEIPRNPSGKILRKVLKDMK